MWIPYCLQYLKQIKTSSVIKKKNIYKKALFKKKTINYKNKTQCNI